MVHKSLTYELMCFSEHKKDPGIPNLFPFKEEILKQAEDKKRRVGNIIDLKLSCIVHVSCFTLKKYSACNSILYKNNEIPASS